MNVSRALFVTTLVLVTALTNLSQQVIPHSHKIAIGDKTLEVKPAKTDDWKRKVSGATKTSRSTDPSKARVQELAKEFGLFNKTAMNPHLAFTNDDIDYWSGRKINEATLILEFSARRLILEQADEQRIAIADRKVLAQAAQEVITLLQKPTPDPISSTIFCSGDSSEEFVKQSWDALDNKDYEKVLACTNNAIRKWSRQADSQQLKAAAKGCGEPPLPEEDKAYFTANWALSDIATAWFIRGEALREQAKWSQAREAYKNVIDKYSCAFTMSRKGYFWRTADAAQEKYEEIRLK